jgi:hypothetical protein
LLRPNRCCQKGVLIGFATKLGSGSSGVSTIWNLSRSSTLSTTTIKVVGIPQMVFTNPITTIHVNRTTYRPLMSSMIVGRYKNVDAMHLRGGY